MLIDMEVLEIEDIIEIINNPKEFIDRCHEAIDLLNTNQNTQGEWNTTMKHYYHTEK